MDEPEGINTAENKEELCYSKHTDHWPRATSMKLTETHRDSQRLTQRQTQRLKPGTHKADADEQALMKADCVDALKLPDGLLLAWCVPGLKCSYYGFLKISFHTVCKVLKLKVHHI